MDDTKTEHAPAPIQVAQNATGAQASTAARDVLLVVSALPTLMAVLGKGDVQAMVNYLASTDFAPVLGVIVTAGVLGYRQWLARRTHANSAFMARNTPDSVAIVKGEG